MQDGDVLVTSPAHLTRLGGLSAMARPALMLSAGAPLPMSAADEAERLFGVVPTEIFGSTETGAMASRTARFDVPWSPLPGAAVGCAGDGLLALEAPWVDGVHLGADTVSVAADGCFHLHGRADRVVKVEGKRVGLAAVEAALCALPQVADAAVLVLAGGRDQLAAAVVPSALGSEELARLGPFRLGRRLRASLAERLEPLARPRLWRFVAELPRTDMGKRPDAAVAALFSHHEGAS
jgi:acyl-coenzyme A synthetase/AMP-(fatty) acid ligase